ncbi:MAG: TIGR03761 family integrating conjugative element protein [Nitrococcus sp.]|nr:TIGR03761 family integrating conjugative element protein [Nitrococcus sp.]
MIQSLSTESASPSSGTNPAQPEDRPGVLRGGAVLTLQTHLAQRLVKGRGYSAEKPAIIGLIGFANLVRSVWHGARADDPYADWWMLRIHDALDHAEQELSSMERALAPRYEAMGALEVASPVSVKPVRVTLNFSNPYAFRAARLVGVFDALACKVLSARHVGLLTREEAERSLQQGGRVLRRALQSPIGYRFMGVTRRDLEQATAKAVQAMESMGEVPGEVLAGTRRAAHAPAIVNEPRANPVTDPIRLRALPNSA